MTKPHVILLPGLLLDQRLYRAQIPVLSDLARVSCADLTQSASVADMAEGVLASAPKRFGLAALSMGGYVALEIMRRAPERVTRLALLDTQARPDTDETQQRRRDLMAQAELGKFKGVTRRLLPLLIHPGRLDDQPLVEVIMAMAQSVGKAGFLRQQQAILGRADSRPSLGAISCPTLILGGREDTLTPPGLQEEMAAAIPGATLVILSDCGHLSPLERPAAVSAQLRAMAISQYIA